MQNGRGGQEGASGLAIARHFDSSLTYILVHMLLEKCAN